MLCVLIQLWRYCFGVCLTLPIRHLCILPLLHVNMRRIWRPLWLLWSRVDFHSSSHFQLCALNVLSSLNMACFCICSEHRFFFIAATFQATQFLLFWVLIPTDSEPLLPDLPDSKFCNRMGCPLSTCIMPNTWIWCRDLSNSSQLAELPPKSFSNNPRLSNMYDQKQEWCLR